jgi:KDO2-lipid IV(A) lauroyltransferase
MPAGAMTPAAPPLATGPSAGGTDVREGGTWTRRQRLKNDAIVAFVRAVLAVLVPLPPRLVRAVGQAIGAAGLLLLPLTARALRTLGIALPHATVGQRLALVTRSYLALGGHLGDALASLDVRRPLVALAVGPDDLALLARAARAARAGTGEDGAPRGVVFPSAHLGPWERVAATLVARGVPMTVLARASYDPRLQRVYDRLRQSRGVPALYRGHPGAPGGIVRALRSGRVLAIPMDLRSRVPSVPVPFLGRTTGVPVGPARIALRTGAAVVVGTIAPGARRSDPMRITCTEIPTFDLVPGEAGERTLTERIALELERRIRALPGEWVWMHDRFGGLQ